MPYCWCTYALFLVHLGFIFGFIYALFWLHLGLVLGEFMLYVLHFVLVSFGSILGSFHQFCWKQLRHRWQSEDMKATTVREKPAPKPRRKVCCICSRESCPETQAEGVQCMIFTGGSFSLSLL